MYKSDEICDICKSFSEDVNDFWQANSVPIIENPDPTIFLRDYVSAFQPVIMKGLIDDWTCMNWTMETIGDKITDTHMNLTPDGYGDGIKDINGEKIFVYPAETMMNWNLFKHMLYNRNQQDAIPYLSQQDDNLRKSFPELMKDIQESIPLADICFGQASSEAINLWIGDDRAVSSLHKDYFENFYCVLQGEKTFTLYPPTDILYLPEIEVKTKRYVLDTNKTPGEATEGILASSLSLVSEGCFTPNIRWIDFDPDATQDNQSDHHNHGHPPPPPLDEQQHSKNSLVHLAHPVRCRVRRGEVLYIPAMWYHRVSQTELTIAVNYWYEQRFDFRYCFAQLSNKLKQLLPISAAGRMIEAVDNHEDEQQQLELL